MDYLPEKKRTQQAQIRKKDQKLKDFRHYLADKEVVLAIVKCKYLLMSHSHLFILFTDLLSVRTQKQWPDDPDQHMRDFFGNYRDPMWDKMDEIKENMEVMRNDMPEMEKRIGELEAELALEKRKTQGYVLYKAADTEHTVSINRIQ